MKRAAAGSLACAALLLAAPLLAATWHVSVDAAGGGDGSETAPFRLIADGMAAAAPGDTVRLGPGVYSETVPLVAYGLPRQALLLLDKAVTVRGAGRDQTVLAATPSTIYTFGIAGVGVDSAAAVSDLTIAGACFQGINLRGASPRLDRLDVVNDPTGGSSVACDLRDGSFAIVRDCLFDGGHTALVVEFGSAGRFVRCTIGARPNDGLICNDGSPVLEDCVFAGAGRDVLVLTQGSQPILRACRVADGGAHAVRVALYPAGSRVDLSGNRWFSDDPAVIRARIRDATVDPALGATVVIEPLDDSVPVRTRGLGDVKALFR